MESFLNLLVELVKGLGITMSLFAVTLACSIPLGFLGSQVSLTKIKPVKFIYTIYLTVTRGTPLILQVLFFYFGFNIIMPALGLSIRIQPMLAAFISFVINYTAYFSEIFRGGIQSINRGQHEAASVLGLTKGMTTRKIIIPQVFKIVMPSLGNEVITLVKDTALVYIIALEDLLYAAFSAMSRDASVMPIVVAAVFYLAINGVVSVILKKIENRVNYYRI